MTINTAIELFISDYKYGDRTEQIKERNPIANLFDNMTSLTYKSFLYPGSTNKFDTKRVRESKEQLSNIGGKYIRMKTPDGDFLDSVYIKAKNFKKIFENYLTLLSITETSLKSEDMVFTLKPEFCTREKTLFSPLYTYKPSDEGAIKFLKTLQNLKFGELCLDGEVPDFVEEEEEDISVLARGINFRLFYLPKEVEKLRSINEEISSNPTVLISGGNGGLYIFYKTLAALYLIRGLDVIMANFRGYGTSTGTPTSYNTKLDLETVYQYLSKEQNVKNEDILLHAHCLGAGSATDLAARRDGINIIVDRSFANIQSLIKKGITRRLTASKYVPKEISERISNLVADLSKFTITYDNVTNLSKIKGNVAIVIANNDEIVPKEEAIEQINSREEKTVIYTDVKHNNLWISSDYSIDNETETEQFNQFLINMNLYRKMFELVSSEVNIAA